MVSSLAKKDICFILVGSGIGLVVQLFCIEYLKRHPEYKFSDKIEKPNKNPGPKNVARKPSYFIMVNCQ